MISYFDQTSISDGFLVTSHLDTSSVVTALLPSGDPFFDSTSKIGSAYVYYLHEGGRQYKKVVHDAVTHEGVVSWSATARDGTWVKDRVKVYSIDGAFRILDRATIGTGEDLDHTNGQTLLNIL